MSDDFQIDFSVKPTTWRPAVFSITISAGMMIDWQNQMPIDDSLRDRWQSAKLQLLLDDNCFYDGQAGPDPITIKTMFDDFQDHDLVIKSSGLKFIPCTDEREHRLGFVIHDISVESVSILDLLSQSVNWNRDDGIVQSFSNFIADNGFATVSIKHPVFQWLLDHDHLLRAK